MNVLERPNYTIETAYRQKTPGSARLADAASSLFPSGVTHDGRHLKPYGVYIERADKAHKWDVDGNRYIDYYGGHGALILGHNHPAVAAATQNALTQGTHFAAGHAYEIRWGELVRQLIPSAERVRFMSSGTEASMMAVRMARAHSGKTKILRFRTHFHGWHDHLTAGWVNHFDGTAPNGVLEQVASASVMVDPNDIDAMRSYLETDPDIAAVILEPTGATFGQIPTRDGFLETLREVTAKTDTLLIFDEVVTGFRVSPGGAQAHYRITPDVTILAKILAGGMSGGAVAGRRDILDLVDFEAASARGFEKIGHPGTFNANPVSAAAGVAALEVVSDGEPHRIANARAAQLRQGFNHALAELGVAWAAYGEFSGVHLFTNVRGRKLDPWAFDPFDIPFMELKDRQPGLVHRVRVAMLLNGVDLTAWPGGLVSAAHTEEDIEATIEAFREAISLLQREGSI